MSEEVMDGRCEEYIICPRDTQAEIRELFQRYFAQKLKWKIAAILEDAVLDTCTFGFSDDFEWFLTAVVSQEALERHGLCGADLRRELTEALHEVRWGRRSRMLGRLVMTVTDSQETHHGGLNNCFFKTETTTKHEELLFRSQAEIAVYDELKKRRLLFLPNAAAVLGGERPEKREPDFLVCQDGRWGILEVMGDAYHKNAAKDHDRARLFKDAGVLCIEFFPASECLSQPGKVVDRFLSILSQHR